MASVEHIEVESGGRTLLVNVAHIMYVTELPAGARIVLSNGEQLETDRDYRDFVHFFDASRTAAAIHRV